MMLLARDEVLPIYVYMNTYTVKYSIMHRVSQTVQYQNRAVSKDPFSVNHPHRGQSKV